MNETKGERTAQRILDAAEILFARKGYEAASLREIAALAGIRQPGLYNHFASKEELYRAVLDRGLQPLVELMVGLLDAPIRQANMIDLPGRMTDLLARHPNISALLMQSMHTANDAGVLIAREWLDRLLDHGRQVNEASDFADDDASTYYVSATTGAVLERRNDTWRWWDFFWMLHNMDYADRTSFNHPLVITAGIAMAWLAVTGFWLLFRTMWRHDFVWIRIGRRDHQH